MLSASKSSKPRPRKKKKANEGWFWNHLEPVELHGCCVALQRGRHYVVGQMKNGQWLAIIMTACGSNPSGTLDAGPDGGRPDGGSCSNCYGCCLDGECKAGTGHIACGAGNIECIACTDLQTCVDGACRPTCDDTTCLNGCCQDGTCVVPDGGNECAANGAACGTCPEENWRYARAMMTYTYEDFQGGGCNTRLRSCTARHDTDAGHAAFVVSVYRDAGCEVTMTPPTTSSPEEIGIDCTAANRCRDAGNPDLSGMCCVGVIGTSGDRCQWDDF